MRAFPSFLPPSPLSCCRLGFGKPRPRRVRQNKETTTLRIDRRDAAAAVIVSRACTKSMKASLLIYLFPRSLPKGATTVMASPESTRGCAGIDARLRRCAEKQRRKDVVEYRRPSVFFAILGQPSNEVLVRCSRTSIAELGPNFWRNALSLSLSLSLLCI